MSGRGRRSSKRKSDRKKEANEAIIHLSTVLESNLGDGPQMADIAASQILAVAKKHGVRPSHGAKRKICRSCKRSMMPGLTSRVRINSKVLITTCLRCGGKYRQGPDFGGLNNE